MFLEPLKVEVSLSVEIVSICDGTDKLIQRCSRVIVLVYYENNRV